MVLLLANSELFATVNSELFFVDNIKMKYPEYAARFKRAWKELKAPIKTQKELAKVLGVAQATVSDWINGEKLPSMDTALEISEKLDCSVLWLLTGKTETANTEPTNHTGYLESANLTPEQLLLIKGMIAQFEQTNPVKAENKSLTYPAENVGGGGVKEPSAACSVAPPYDANVRLELYDDYLLSIKQSCLDNDCYCDVHTNTNTILGATFKIRID